MSIADEFNKYTAPVAHGEPAPCDTTALICRLVEEVAALRERIGHVVPVIYVHGSDKMRPATQDDIDRMTGELRKLGAARGLLRELCLELGIRTEDVS